ncbi:hypothetical protein ACFWY6_32820 [Streptomyces sp. NPDC059037]|uniref:hypothetical protein n=1 Tax=Streptomyces sp. NPDC059037 TaxID=3346710 RepID=UPI00367460DC
MLAEGPSDFAAPGPRVHLESRDHTAVRGVEGVGIFHHSAIIASSRQFCLVVLSELTAVVQDSFTYRLHWAGG